MLEDFVNDEEAVAYKTWVQSTLNKPGVAVLTYSPQNVVPSRYEFQPCPDPDHPSVGIRLFLTNYAGDVHAVDYMSAYPSVKDGEPAPASEISDLPDGAVEQMWVIGWRAALGQSAELIGRMQADLMYAEADRIGFDIEGFLAEASEHLPWFVATQLSVTYLQFLRVRHEMMSMPEAERISGAMYLLGLVGEILAGIEDAARGESEG